MNKHVTLLSAGILLAGAVILQVHHATPVDAQTRLGWSTFEYLVQPDHTLQHSSSGDPIAMWSNWSDKCKVGLPGDCNSSKLLSKLTIDIRAAERPLQFQSQTALPERFLPNKLPPRQTPTLATVLFNGQAAAAIENHSLGDADVLQKEIAKVSSLQGYQRALPTDYFAESSNPAEASIALKLIWSVVPLDGSALLSLWDDTQLPQTSDPIPARAYWSQGFYLDPNSESCSAPLPQYGAPGNAPKIPIGCFFYKKIDDLHACADLNPGAAEVFCRAGETPHYAAVLVGFHVMVLTPSRPKWQWMTFYWTRVPNQDHPKWTAPWKFFHMMTTSDVAEKETGKHRYVFNPYLEGTQSVTSNCVSCHQFAAYSPTPPAKSASAGCLGLAIYTGQERQQEEDIFFDKSIRTNFLWSISTSQTLKQPPPGTPVSDPLCPASNIAHYR